MENRLRFGDIKQSKMAFDESISYVLFTRLRRLAAQNKLKEASIVNKAIRILFPRTADCIFATYLFEGYKAVGRYKEAIAAYKEGGKPFWLSEEVGMYYEKRGLINKAMNEYEQFIEECLDMDVLPLPGGPIELFKLGRWYIPRDQAKAENYLRLYLKAGCEGCSGSGFGIRHRKETLQLLGLQENQFREREAHNA